MTQQYIKGFERACTLILGTNTRWTKKDVAIRNRVTRKMFGRKRK